MILKSEQQKKIDKLYEELNNLRKGKKILENTMHKNFYNKTYYNHLFTKLDKINLKIKLTKKELAKEKREYEKSKVK